MRKVQQLVNHAVISIRDTLRREDEGEEASVARYCCQLMRIRCLLGRAAVLVMAGWRIDGGGGGGGGWIG